MMMMIITMMTIMMTILVTDGNISWRGSVVDDDDIIIN